MRFSGRGCGKTKNERYSENGGVMKTRISLKLFCLVALGGFFCPYLMDIPQVSFAASSKQPLTQADFTYLGAFDMPAVPNTASDWGKGLALRYVSGELHIFAGTWNPQDVYEARVPTPSKTSIPVATFIKDWAT